MAETCSQTVSHCHASSMAMANTTGSRIGRHGNAHRRGRAGMAG
jgi:hypothetical protein